MEVSAVVDLGREALWVAVLVSGPILGTALLVGILIGVLQAATSVQEMTLSFIPKLGAMILAMVLFGGWQLNILTEFFKSIFERIPTLFF
tara:strand:- start:263 stop:532 length:270 start_codon:yes stop_codon:yes gene_type:complete